MIPHHWRKITVALSIACLVVPAGQVLAAESWAQVADQIGKDQDATVKQAADTEEIIEKDRETLQEELDELKAREKREDRALERLQKQFENLLKDEAQLVQELASEQEEIQAVEGTVRASAKQASTLIRDNPITPEFPERPVAIAAITESKRFPGLEGIKSLVEVYFQEMAAGGTIRRRTGDFVGPDGRNTTGEILRIGRFTTFYRLPDGSTGFLTPEPSGERLIAIQGKVPGGLQRAIKSYLNNESVVLPVDPSGGGLAFAKFGAEETFWEWIQRGGMLMYPILIVGICATILGLIRLWELGRARSATDPIMDRINVLASKGDIETAQEYCETHSNIPTCQMLGDVMVNAGASMDILINAVEESNMRIEPRLRRFLPTLSILAMISPLLGLLGTVTGMIDTFQVITMVGTGDPRMMSGGISQALLTTQFGLMTAVPIMLLHHILDRRVERYTNEMDEKGKNFIVSMMKANEAVEA